MNLDNGLTIPPRNPDVLETTVLNILRTYNAQMWLPGPSKVAENYEDSTGIIPLTSVNGVVGCVADETSSGIGENLCANSEFVGVSLGTTPPPGIGFSAGGGIVMSCVGFGTDDLGSYMDVRWLGTAAATVYPGVSLLPGGIIPAIAYELVSAGCFIELLSGTPPSTCTLLMNGYTAGVAYVQQANSAQISGPRAYYTSRKVFDNATVANCGAVIQLSCPIGSVVDVTMRIWKPQVNRGVLMPYLPTTGTRVVNPYANIGLNSLTTANKPTLYGGCTSVISNGFDLNASSWSVTNGTRIAGSQYGTSRSTILVGDSTAGQHYLSNSSPTPVKDNTTYYACIQAKSISGNPLFRLQCRKKDGSVCYMNVDLDSGLLFNAPTGVLSADVVRKEGGFWQLRMSFNSATGASGPNLVALLIKGDSVSAEGTSIEMMNCYLSDSPAIYDINPVLTSHYLSVPIAPYSWKFDGSADRLQMAKINVDPASDHFVICAFKMPPAVISAARATVGYGNAGAQERLQIIFLSSNVINCFWRDAAGVAVSILSDQPARAVNEKLCITMRRKAGNFYGSVKGSVTAAAAGNTPVLGAAWVPTLGFVGGSASTGSFTFQWEDEVYGVISGNGAPSDAELAILESFLIGCAAFTPVP